MNKRDESKKGDWHRSQRSQSLCCYARKLMRLAATGPAHSYCFAVS